MATSFGDHCFSFYSDIRKGQPSLRILILFALGLTQAPIRSFSRVGSSGICSVTHDFLATNVPLTYCSSRLPVRLNAASPQLYDSQALLQAVFGLFFI